MFLIALDALYVFVHYMLMTPCVRYPPYLTCQTNLPLPTCSFCTTPSLWMQASSGFTNSYSVHTPGLCLRCWCTTI